MMSEFHVKQLFPVSFRPVPFVVGDVTGDFTAGQAVELRKPDGSKHRGVLEALDFHHHGTTAAFVFSVDIASHIEPGDIVLSCPV